MRGVEPLVLSVYFQVFDVSLADFFLTSIFMRYFLREKQPESLCYSLHMWQKRAVG